MRVSVDREDPGFTNGALYAVTLNGVDMGDAVTADDELGIVVTAKRDDQGGLLWHCDGIQFEELRGEVVITPVPLVRA